MLSKRFFLTSSVLALLVSVFTPSKARARLSDSIKESVAVETKVMPPEQATRTVLKIFNEGNVQYSPDVIIDALIMSDLSLRDTQNILTAFSEETGHSIMDLLEKAVHSARKYKRETLAQELSYSLRLASPDLVFALNASCHDGEQGCEEWNTGLGHFDPDGLQPILAHPELGQDDS